jgi:hypothetical protein
VKQADRAILLSDWAKLKHQTQFFAPSLVRGMRLQLNHTRHHAALNRFLLLAVTDSLQWDTLSTSSTKSVSPPCVDGKGRLLCSHCNAILNAVHVFSSCADPRQNVLRTAAVQSIRSLVGDEDDHLHNDVMKTVLEIFDVPLADLHEPRARIRLFGVVDKLDKAFQILASKMGMNPIQSIEFLQKLRCSLAEICYDLFSKSKQLCCHTVLPSESVWSDSSETV